jgi:hypothetical protein
MMKTSSVPLYFPDGAPPNVQRLMSPDAVHKLVATGLKGVDTDWKKLSRRADVVTQGIRPWWKRLFGGSLEVDLVYVMNRLYQPLPKWPRGLSDEQVEDLSVLRLLRQYSSSAVHTMSDKQLSEAPTDAEMTKAFKLLAKDAAPIVDEAEASFQNMLSKVGREIEPLCEATYGEPCDPGEGAEVAMADVRDLLRMGRIPSMSPTGNRVMRALWQSLR